MQDLYSWMTGRINQASKGMILDHEAKQLIRVNEAPSRIFLEHTSRRAAYNRDFYTVQVERSASDQAKAEKSDPFTRDRIRTHLRGGLCNMEDYSVEFKKKEEDVLDLSGKAVITIVTETPTNMKRP